MCVRVSEVVFYFFLPLLFLSDRRTEEKKVSLSLSRERNIDESVLKERTGGGKGRDKAYSPGLGVEDGFRLRAKVGGGG